MHYTVCVATAPLLLFTLSCSESGASSVVGEYAVDVDASPSWGDAVMSMSVVLRDDMTYGTSAVFEFPGREKETNTTEGTWTLRRGTITLHQTHEDGEVRALEPLVTATVEDGVLSIFLDGELTSVYNRKR